MRVCIIGDSHIAALKSGWDLIQNRFASADVTFFGAARPNFADLAVSGGKLMATSRRLQLLFEKISGGLIAITGDFDRYILCGLGGNLATVSAFVRLYAAERHGRGSGVRPLSDACYQACLRGLLDASMMAVVLGKLRQITGAPTALVSSPFPGPREGFEAIYETGDDRIIAAQFIAAFEELAKAHGARFVPQARETLSGPLVTESAFFEGAVRLFEGEDDQLHANGRYGAIMLALALEALA
jgi:hypothetical protein